MGNSATVDTGEQRESQHLQLHLLAMHLLVLLLAAAVCAQDAPPPPPDRIWFRQDSLPAGETCATVAKTAALITGKDPIILTDDANFKICIKFLGEPTPTLKLERLPNVLAETGPMTVERKALAQQDAVSFSLDLWLRNTLAGSLPAQTVPTLAEQRKHLCTSNQRLGMLQSCVPTSLRRLMGPLYGSCLRVPLPGVWASAVLS